MIDRAPPANEIESAPVGAPQSSDRFEDDKSPPLNMATEPSSSAVKLRSIYVSSPGDEIESAAPVEGAPQISDRFEDDKSPPAPSDPTFDHAKDPVLLPQSTHSLLFTEPVFSAPFAFAVAIDVVSFGCLGLAFTDGYQVNDIPVNVTAAVRGAQYLSIIVALLMEEGECCMQFS